MGSQDTESIVNETLDYQYEREALLAKTWKKDEMNMEEEERLAQVFQEEDKLNTNYSRKDTCQDERLEEKDTEPHSQEHQEEPFILSFPAKPKLNLIFKVTREDINVSFPLLDSSLNNSSQLKKCPLKIVKQPRKMLPDSLRKKIKTHFHRYLIYYFNNMIVAYYKFKKYVIQKINKEKTLKVNINYCSKLLQLTMKELFSTEISTKCTKKKADHNKRIIQILEQKDCFTSFLNKSYEQMYVEYRHSETFKNDVSKLKNKYGNYYCKSFLMIADDFINYYKKEIPLDSI